MKYDILVLMSTYNGEKYLEEQLESILNQKGCDVNILIRDDGSADQTVDILNRYEQIYTNITIIRDDVNLGPAHSFMRLLHGSEKHDFYAFADQDDVWDSDKLVTGINEIINCSVPALYASNARLVNSAGVSLNILEHKEKKIHVNPETVLCISQFLGCTMIFNDNLAQFVKMVKTPDLIIMHDYYLSCVCILCGGVIIYDPKPHISYRQHGLNTVGISLDFKTKIRKKLSYIFSRKKVYVHMQTKELLLRYEPYMNSDLKRFAGVLEKTGHSFKARLTVALSFKVHYANFNQAFIYRCAYLLGNK